MIWRLARGTFLKAFAALFLALPMRDGLAAQKAVSAADRRAGIIRFLTANGLVAADNTASRLFAEAVASDAFSELNEDDALAVWRLTPLPELAAMRAQTLVEWCRALEAEGARPEIWCAVYLVLAQVSYDYRSCTSYTVKGKPGPLVTTHCFDDYAEALKAAKVAPLLEELLRGSDWICR